MGDGPTPQCGDNLCELSGATIESSPDQTLNRSDSEKGLAASDMLDVLVNRKKITRQEVAQAEYIIVKYTAEWCPPCKTMADEVKKLKAEVGDKLLVVDIDVDREAFINGQQPVGYPASYFLVPDGNSHRYIISNENHKNIAATIPEEQILGVRSLAQMKSLFDINP